MGEVYRARDARLGRDVAIKILPEAFASDPERLARFQREAQLLASLNHPNIAIIHGLEGDALIMELVEGPTLADRIGHGPLPLDEALPLAKQIAEALEAAHERGVVHRDLKPANVKVTPEGRVKVLDFGLAKLVEPGATSDAGAARGLTMSPTLSVQATYAGVILGTAAYMSPEQARGKAADRRADIWAFGCVLFEMLTGKQAFDAGETVSDAVAAILKNEPDWDALPAETPAHVRTLLRRCLRKDMQKRLPHIGVARIEIEEGVDSRDVVPGSIAVVPGWRRAVPWMIAAGSLALAVVAFVMDSRPADAPSYQLSVLPPRTATWAAVTPATRFTISRDGRRLAFIANDVNEAGRVTTPTVAPLQTRLWVRSLDGSDAAPLMGTGGVTLAAWSPDARQVAFVADGQLKKIDTAGGAPVVIADRAANAGLAWTADDTILFVPDTTSPIHAVPAAGGTPRAVTSLDKDAGDSWHAFPFVLPGNRHVVYTAVGSKSDPLEARAVYALRLDASEPPRLVLPRGSNVQYASGHLLYMRDATLVAHAFDSDRLVLSGEPSPIATDVQIGGSSGRLGAFAVAETGVLLHQAGASDVRTQLTWINRDGKAVAVLGEPADYDAIEISPAGTQAAVTVAVSGSNAIRDIWLFDLRRGIRTRVTNDTAAELTAAWSPDGRYLVFGSGSRIMRRAVDGSRPSELLFEADTNLFPYSWASDGRFVLFNGTGIVKAVSSTCDIGVLPIEPPGPPQPMMRVPSCEARGRFSPDGRWVAYSSGESGRAEVYVVAFPDANRRQQVSVAGGDWPRWSRNGREIYYLAPDGGLMAVPVTSSGSQLRLGDAERLFDSGVRTLRYGYDVSPDGQRFLVNRLLEGSSLSPITAVINWPSLLPQR